MFLDKKVIKNSQKKLAEISSDIEEKSRFYNLGSDPTRLKIIFLLKLHKELCPTDISQVLHISMSAVSHQMALLEKGGLVKKKKIGKIVCYMITKEGKKLI